MTPPSILITNDDGIDAPGLRALAAAMARLGSVQVVAPDRDQSGVSRMISLGRPLRVTARRPGWWAVDGTPTDCVYLALHELLASPPDLVVSGINRGPNLADDVTYSGTVAGAMEGALAGIPSVAVSLVGEAPLCYEPAADFAVSVAQYALDQGLPRRTLLNVNVPDSRGAAVRGYRWTRAGDRDYGHTVTQRLDPRGQPYYWIGGRFLGFKSVAGSDCDAIAEGLAAITPLTLDLTHTALLQRAGRVQLTGYSSH